jgi:hypothetical protein
MARMVSVLLILTKLSIKKREDNTCYDIALSYV